jgi:DNA (cytosine-5)-methyltransferase 1
MGYHQAGFTGIVGVDIAPQPNYPFTFIQGDALQPPVRLEDFDLIHASPPCQHHTKYRNAVTDITSRYQDVIPDTLALLATSPSVIENVPGAPIHADLILCGSHFGLDVRRHRHFQLNHWTSFGPGGCNHKGWARRFKSSTDRPNLRFTIEVGAWDESLARQKDAMGVDWPITVRELSEAIPPAYTKYIGEQFITQWG